MTKIALIEDDDTMRSLLKTLLELEGFATINIHPDDEPISTIQIEKPDVLLLDVHLKHSSGITLLKEIRETAETTKLVVFMTSGMDLEDICLKNGADGFLLKPYMPDELIKLIKNVETGAH